MHIIIATHGDLAESYIRTATMISGKEMLEGVEAICMKEETSIEQFMERTLSILRKDELGQYLILSDLFGASPSNTIISIFRNSEYRLVTGVNLGMLLEALFMKDRSDLDEVASSLEMSGRNGIKKVFLHI